MPGLKVSRIRHLLRKNYQKLYPFLLEMQQSRYSSGFANVVVIFFIEFSKYRSIE
jgi:hypothetical protein